jgi:adenine-specific DNA-methyltransferase
MDEVFGSINYCGIIFFLKTSGKGSGKIDPVGDYLLWYGKNAELCKIRPQFTWRDPKTIEEQYNMIELEDGTSRRLTASELRGQSIIPQGRRFMPSSMYSDSGGNTTNYAYTFDGREYYPLPGYYWRTNKEGMDKLVSLNRIIPIGNYLRYKMFAEDYPVVRINNLWADVRAGGFGIAKEYVVQTNTDVIQRCILMTTDPGDLVLDPTCGSGTTAYVAEQWGRRWITIDTSRIALNIAKTRLMTSTFPYYRLHDEEGQDIRQGFIYKKVPHITLKSLANDEPSQEETLFDQPEIDNKRLRVSGPFTVETLQNFEPELPEALDQEVPNADELEQFEERVFEHLKFAGVKNGIRDECAVFTRVDRLNHAYLHAEGFYQAATGEKKAYLHIGPKFGTVSRQAVNEAIRECRLRGDADWLIILGFSFESDISTGSVTTSMGTFEVTKNRMHDDLMQDGLLKHDKKAASFVTIGEPDIRLHRDGDTATVEISGLDIYDPIKDEVKARNVADIAYWMVDDDYDGSNFIVRQVFFCGGDKDEFDAWKKGLSRLAEASTKKKAEKTLKIEIDDDAFSRLYGFQSHPIPITHPAQKVAVRVISQFGEESTKVLES